MNLPEVGVGDMTEAYQAVHIGDQTRVFTDIHFWETCPSDLWLMKLITCHMDYLTNEHWQAEIHPTQECKGKVALRKIGALVVS